MLAIWLENFEIGLVNNVTEEDPDRITLPARGTYPICGNYTGMVETSGWAERVVRCNSTTPPGRYVIIRQPEGVKSQMVICTINVFLREGERCCWYKWMFKCGFWLQTWFIPNTAVILLQNLITWQEVLVLLKLDYTPVL